MKTLPLICLSLLLSIIAPAQFINSIGISPQQPTTSDTIYIYPTVSFGYGSCDDHTQFISINGNNISASATHCIGMLTVMCTATDTFKIDPLPAGNYTFHFNVNEGAYPAPCIPGIMPGPSDSLNFNVIDLSSIIENNFNNELLYVYPNPSSDYLTIYFKNKNQKRTIELITIEGKVVGNYKTDSDTFRLDTDNLPNGIYLVTVSENNITKKQLVTIQK